jgi:hypothetical protein
MSQELEFTIDDEGNITVEAFGFEDSVSCLKAAEKAMKALGTVKSTVAKRVSQPQINNQVQRNV